MRNYFKIISFCILSMITQSFKLLMVAIAVILLTPSIVQATASLKPEYRNIVDNVWKNKKEWLKAQINSQIIVDGTSDTFVLYDVALYTSGVLFYAKNAQDNALLDDLAEVYLTAYGRLSTKSKYLYSYWPVNHGTNYQSIHDLETPNTRMWLDTPVTIGSDTVGKEDILSSAQFLYMLAQLCNAITSIPAGSRTANMNTFLTDFVPVILNDHYKRWIFDHNLTNSKGVFQVHAYGGIDEHYNHNEFLQKKHDLFFTSNPARSYINVVTDSDMYIIGGVVEMLAASDATVKGAGNNITIDPTYKQDLLNYVALGSNLLADRMVSSALTKFDGTTATAGVNFEPGYWDDHSDYYYSGDMGDTTPLDRPHNPADNVGWDISHARRFVSVFSTLYDNKSTTGMTWPTLTIMQQLTNQIVYGAFNKDLSTAPKTTNYMDGTNGWYRVGYSGITDPGIPPYGLCIATANGGYGFWSRFNSDVTLMENSIWDKIKKLHARDVSGHFRDCVVTLPVSVNSGNPFPLDGYVTFDGASSLKMGIDSEYSSSAGSIELWFNPSDAGREEDLICIKEKAYEDYLLIRRKSDNTIMLLIEDGNVSKTSLTSTVTINVGAWNHLAITHNGSSTNIYINGVLAGTNSTSTYWTSHLAIDSFTVGNSDWASHQFKGKISDMRIYSTALTDTEVISNYNSKRATAHWTFDATHQYTSNNSTPVTGKVGQGVSFDGSTQYIQTLASSTLSSTTGSIQLWFKENDSTKDGDLVFVTANSGTSNYLLIRKKSNGTILVQAKDATTARISRTSGSSFIRNEWNHLSVIQDGVNGVKICINGVESTGDTGTNSTSYWTNQIVNPYIKSGKCNTSWSTCYFNGTIDELQVFSGIALTTAEVANNFNSGTRVYNRTFDWSSETYTANNAVTISGEIGQGVSFNGSTQYIQSAVDTKLSSIKGTVQLWFKENDSTKDGDLVFVTANSGTSNYLLIRKKSNGTILVQSKDATTARISRTSGSSFIRNEWNHLSVIQDGVNGVKIYINGVESTGDTGTNSTSYWTNQIVNPYIKSGKCNTSWSTCYFNGTIDELQVFDYALSTDQMKAEYRRAVSLLSSWEFGDAQDTTALDFVKIYYGTDYNMTDSMNLLQFMPSFMTY